MKTRQEYNKRYYHKKRDMGWRNVIFMVPDEVAVKLKEYKKRLLDSYSSQHKVTL